MNDRRSPIDDLRTISKHELERSRSLLNEFKAFAIKGNVIDLAVGVVIGGAFGKIVTSVVSDLLMPPVGKLMGDVNFPDLFINLDPTKRLANGNPVRTLADAKAAGVAVIAYGNFINTVLDFLIVAFCVFIMVKAFNKLKRKEEVAPSVTPPPEVQLLTEIRDLLQKK